ncbi:MAG: DUF2065 domain-containing protein [Desulfomonile sp.]|jgi:uncharacterized protein YjeT (DUF2065 family)|nr:DUF2065 domain-containing protein [Deltaproteobacteria bacterium]
MEFFLCVLGMVMVIEGLPYFGMPERMKAFMMLIQQQGDSTLRILGAALMLFGLLILFFARNGLISG